MEMEVKGMKSQRKELEKEVQEKVGKKPFEEPELIFIEPKLTKHGYATRSLLMIMLFSDRLTQVMPV